MKEFTVRVVPDSSRPIVSVYGMDALIDTGADVPVVSVMAIDFLIDRFHAKTVLKVAKIRGFGGEEHGDVLVIDQFVFGDLVFPNMHVFVPKRTLAFPFVLSASMFNRLVYEIDMKNHAMTVRIPDDESNVRNLLIQQQDGELYVLCESQKPKE